MKKLLILTIVALSASMGYSQSDESKSLLLKKFSSEEINTMDQETLKFNTYCVKNAFVVMDMPKEKAGDHAIKGARNVKDLTNINFFDLDIELIEEEYQYYTLLGTDKMLMIKPISLIKTEVK